MKYFERPIATWVRALVRLDESDEPLTSQEAVRVPKPRPYLERLKRAGCVEIAEGSQGRRWRITAKGREELRAAMRQVSDFMIGES